MNSAQSFQHLIPMLRTLLSSKQFGCLYLLQMQSHSECNGRLMLSQSLQVGSAGSGSVWQQSSLPSTSGFLMQSKQLGTVHGCEHEINLHSQNQHHHLLHPPNRLANVPPTIEDAFLCSNSLLAVDGCSVVDRGPWHHRQQPPNNVGSLPQLANGGYDHNSHTDTRPSTTAIFSSCNNPLPPSTSGAVDSHTRQQPPPHVHCMPNVQPVFVHGQLNTETTRQPFVSACDDVGWQDEALGWQQSHIHVDMHENKQCNGNDLTSLSAPMGQTTIFPKEISSTIGNPIHPPPSPPPPLQQPPYTQISPQVGNQENEAPGAHTFVPERIRSSVWEFLNQRLPLPPSKSHGQHEQPQWEGSQPAVIVDHAPIETTQEEVVCKSHGFFTTPPNITLVHPPSTNDVASNFFSGSHFSHQDARGDFYAPLEYSSIVVNKKDLNFFKC